MEFKRFWKTNCLGETSLSGSCCGGSGQGQSHQLNQIVEDEDEMIGARQDYDNVLQSNSYCSCSRSSKVLFSSNNVSRTTTNRMSSVINGRSESDSEYDSRRGRRRRTNHDNYNDDSSCDCHKKSSNTSPTTTTTTNYNHHHHHQHSTAKKNNSNNNRPRWFAQSNIILGTLLFWVLLFNYQVGDVGADGCPLVCICKWKSGKQTVECRNQNLNTLPADIDIETQVLDISGNKLQVLPRDAFQRAGLLNLQRIYIHGSGLRQIDSGAFNELINLVEIDLSDNHLTAVPTAALRSTPFLRDLNLAGNPLVHIQNGAFEFVTQLVKLDLSRAQLLRVDKNAFSHLQLLESLKISNNSLTTISNYTVKSLTQLHNIELHNNPWNCDCRLHDLKTWLENKNIPYPIPPRCKSPERLTQRKFSDLSASEFACPPKILNDPAETHVKVHEEDNATIVCLYDANPVTSVRWYSFQRLITNNTMISVSRKFLIFEDSIDRSILILTNVLEKDSGDFHCVVENPAGFSEANFTLEVLARPPFPFPTLPTAHIIYIALALLCLLLLLSAGVLITFCRKRRARRTHKPPEILATSTPVKPPRLNYDNGSPTSQNHIHHNNLPNGFGKTKIESATDNPDLILETNNSGSYQETGLEEQSSNSELNWEQQSYRNLGYSTEYPPDYGLPIIHENSVYSEHQSTPNNYFNNSSNLHAMTHSNHTNHSNHIGGGGVAVGNGGIHHSSSSGSGVGGSGGGGAMGLDGSSASGHVGNNSSGGVVGSGSASVLMSGVWSKNKVGTRIVRAPSARDSPDEGYQEGYCGTDV